MQQRLLPFRRSIPYTRTCTKTRKLMVQMGVQSPSPTPHQRLTNASPTRPSNNPRIIGGYVYGAITRSVDPLRII
jgi:hypothetical protein